MATISTPAAPAAAAPASVPTPMVLATMRTREYVEKGESEGKTLIDAMRDGVLEGMQHFDLVIEKMVRDSVIEIDTGLAYATNSGNLRLQLSDLLEGVELEKPAAAAGAAKPKAGGETELPITRL